MKICKSCGQNIALNLDIPSSFTLCVLVCLSSLATGVALTFELTHLATATGFIAVFVIGILFLRYLDSGGKKMYEDQRRKDHEHY